MKQKLDLGYFNEVFKEHYESKAEMARAFGITRSHMQEVFKNKGIGKKFLAGLRKESLEKGFNYDLCLKPNPIIMDGEHIESIVITDEEGGLIASITSKDVITNKGTKVIVVPYCS